jgi:signal transduction histidine kinase
MRKWWRRRGLRARLILIATASLAAGIAAGSLVLLHGFASSRLSAIDSTSRTVADNLTGLIDAGAVPQVLPVDAGQSAQIVTADGAVLATSPGTLRTLPLVPPQDLRRLARSGPRNIAVSTINGQQLSRVRVRPADGRSATEYVVLAVSLAEERDTVAGLTHIVLVAAPLLLLVVAGTLWLLLGRALRTVRDLRVGAEAITDPASGERLPVPASGDEIHDLSVTLNDMIDRLAAASARERAFIADAAHELRSPVAGLRTQLEMAVTRSDPAAYREFTEGALQDAERLSGLIQDLLALARLETGSPVPDRLVDLAEIAAVDAPDPCIVRGDPSTLARAIDNLRDNAARHATSSVLVTISNPGRDTVDVHVDDDGPGVPPEDRERIFERFVRLDTARARSGGGTGLGLAIVRAIAHAHGGTVSVTDSALGGARFTLSLPAVPAEDRPRAKTPQPSR